MLMTHTSPQGAYIWRICCSFKSTSLGWFGPGSRALDIQKSRLGFTRAEDMTHLSFHDINVAVAISSYQAPHS